MTNVEACTEANTEAQISEKSENEINGEIINAYIGGMTIQQIADKYDLNYSRTRNILINAKVPMRRERSGATRTEKRDLTEDEIINILNDYDNYDLKLSDIRKKYNVSIYSINNLLVNYGIIPRGDRDDYRVIRAQRARERSQKLARERKPAPVEKALDTKMSNMQERIEIAAAMRKMGYPTNLIAFKLQLGKSTIDRYLKIAGLTGDGAPPIKYRQKEELIYFDAFLDGELKDEPQSTGAPTVAAQETPPPIIEAAPEPPREYVQAAPEPPREYVQAAPTYPGAPTPPLPSFPPLPMMYQQPQTYQTQSNQTAADTLLYMQSKIMQLENELNYYKNMAMQLHNENINLKNGR